MLTFWVCRADNLHGYEQHATALQVESCQPANTSWRCPSLQPDTQTSQGSHHPHHMYECRLAHGIDVEKPCEDKWCDAQDRYSHEYLAFITEKPTFTAICKICAWTTHRLRDFHSHFEPEGQWFVSSSVKFRSLLLHRTWQIAALGTSDIVMASWRYRSSTQYFRIFKLGSVSKCFPSMQYCCQ